MVIPAAMNIESAFDQLLTMEHPHSKSQADELKCAIGADRAERIGVKYPLTDEFITGYELGLQTARALLAGTTALMLKGVDPADVL